MNEADADRLLIGQPIIYSPTGEWINVKADDDEIGQPLHRIGFIKRNYNLFKLPTARDFDEHFGTTEE